MNSPTIHVPVLLQPVLEGCGLADAAPLDLGPASEDGGMSTPSAAAVSSSCGDSTDSVAGPRILVDGTLGGAGHALRMAECLGPGDSLIGIDRDPAALERVRERLLTEMQLSAVPDGEDMLVRLPSGCDFVMTCGTYCDLPGLLERRGLGLASAILLDLGLSSDQLRDEQRGFSFKASGPLDLRFDPTTGISAAELLMRRSEQDIADLIYQYGEERFSRRIARAIVERRRTEPIETAKELADLVHRCVPGRVHGRIDSATRTFQALRIAVNRELEHVELAMKSLPDCLAIGGRLVVISFHSLEDRIVKHAMRGDPRLRVLTKKPIEADEDEVDRNPRSRSAKLRVAVRQEVPAHSHANGGWHSPGW
jgi:16S rRNA (cytosine1402-N4)-methyltransferase